MTKIKIKGKTKPKTRPLVVKENDDDGNEMDEMEEEAPPKWYEQFKVENLDFKPVNEEELIVMRKEAEHVLEEETQFYNKKKNKGKKGSNATWMKTIMAKGTAKDKLAAHIVSIQNSPIYNLSSISSLVNMVKASKKKECQHALDTLPDLFLEDLLRPDRKLKTFEKQPLSVIDEITSGCALSRKHRLAAWIFEEKLKDLYMQFLDAISIVAKDTVEANRIKAVSTMFKLLNGHPEQEEVLLQRLINKLGDPSQKVVSKVIYCLTQLLRFHPNMKQIVMNEVEKLLFRPNISKRTQYYSICFLSQFIFDSSDKAIAKNLINIYFSFFKSSIKQGEVDSRLMGALLMGVKRAHPFAKIDEGSFSEHIDTLYKLIHLTNFNVALHTLCLLQQVSSLNSDRFYSALYKKLLDPSLTTSTHHAMFINLLYKSLIKDTNINRVKAFVKRILQICLYLPVPLVCGILYLISQLSSKKKQIFDCFLLPKIESEPLMVNFESDEEENYVDLDESKPAVETNVEDERKPLHGWVFWELTKFKNKQRSTCYDPSARNPLFANADKSAYLEITQLSNHFHPTVALFTKKILNKELITYSGDPLTDFTLNRFLERFVFKNPKKQTDSIDGLTKGPDPQLAARKYYKPQGSKALNVTSYVYLEQSEKQIPVDELFLYRYLKERHELRKTEEPDSDNDSVASEEFEQMLDKMVGKKQEMDFLDDIGEKLNKNQTKNKSKVAESESSDDDFSDEEFVDESGEEALDFESDEFDGDIDVDEVLNAKENKKEKKPKFKKTKKNDGLEGLFAPAEEFAEILEDAGASKSKPGMATSFQNQDNSAQKQLDWEKKRDRWAKTDNRNWKRKGNFKPKFTKKQKK